MTDRPQDEDANIRYHRRLEEIARKRGAPVSHLQPPVHTWADAIDLNEGRF